MRNQIKSRDSFVALTFVLRHIDVTEHFLHLHEPMT